MHEKDAFELFDRKTVVDFIACPYIFQAKQGATKASIVPEGFRQNRKAVFLETIVSLHSSLGDLLIAIRCTPFVFLLVPLL